MVYVYARLSKLNQYIGKDLSAEDIKETLVDLGMDIKGESEEKDPELKIEITAEKTDMVSAVGVARAVKYYRGIARGVPKYDLKVGKNKVIVENSVSKVRPRTVCVILRGLEMTQELLDEMIEIQEKVHDSFGRHRKKVSIGIYPCDDFEFPVYFRGEKPEDIKFRPLELEYELSAPEILEKHDTGKKYGHLLEGQSVYPVFRDKNGKVLSLPPIINSHETGRVDLHHKDLFIECSGHNLTYLDNILKVLVTTFIEMGASAESVQVEYEGGEKYELDLGSFEEELDLDYVNKLIGVEFKESEIEKLLNKMMFGLKSKKGRKLVVEIPAFKSDIWHDSDIADDIARAYGYNNIVPRFPNISSVGETLPFSRFRDNVSDTMANIGFLELYTYILSSTKTQFEDMCLGTNGDIPYIRLIDSADQGLNMTRVRILPEVLNSLHINRKNKYPQRVFENGFTIQVDEKKDTGARNEAHLAVAIADPKSNYTQIKGTLDTLMRLLDVKFEVRESKEPFLIEGRAADVFVNKKKIGFIGELHPQVLENFGLIVPVGVFELRLDLLL